MPVLFCFFLFFYMTFLLIGATSKITVLHATNEKSSSSLYFFKRFQLESVWPIDTQANPADKSTGCDTCPPQPLILYDITKAQVFMPRATINYDITSHNQYVHYSHIKIKWLLEDCHFWEFSYVIIYNFKKR